MPVESSPQGGVRASRELVGSAPLGSLVTLRPPAGVQEGTGLT